MKQKIARVYRFNGKVAVHFGEGKTCYLLPSDAQMIFSAVEECAVDIKHQPIFSQSGFRTIEIELSE